MSTKFQPAESWLSPRLEPGSLILISGVTGLVGAAQAKLLLDIGYKVRGTTRKAASAAQLIDHFHTTYGKGAFEVVEVEDGSKEQSWTSAFQGVDGFVHIATDMSAFYSDKPAKEVVDGVVDLTLAVLKAAAKTPSVRSGVLTSSGIAVHYPQEGVEETVDIKTRYNDAMANMAFTAAKDDPRLGLYTYTATKVAADKRAFEFVKTDKPGYAFNVIAPDLVIGSIYNPDPSRRYSSVSMLQDYYLGKNQGLLMAVRANSHFVSVDDVARIQAAALLQPDVDMERLWGASHTFTLPEIHRAMESFSKGTKTFSDPEAEAGAKAYIAHIDNSRSLELVRRLGRPGLQSLEESVAAALEDVERRSG
ncbi:hypothetical protein OC846_005550 [Tilletia horrida]|uniref:NAD-dependent epimerase/dehydratase domain-containing protein n=1 Tax=Tilletia horrida TaxID=155126 RepID=A0AAN6GK97_9BASI|nr:hypothetical protein OC845_005669 [Tilletia horrida]KAK0545705.1 hypothetical protein OC846_005550 [Tilletia horrida]KAK0562407.1 hypothetical protein OC861_005318 [Tilletia horrida]